MLKNEKTNKVLFTCDLINGNCCYGEVIELEDDEFLDDCEGGPFANLSVLARPASFRDVLRWWWKYRTAWRTDFWVTIESLEEMEKKIHEIIPKLKKRKVVLDKKYRKSDPISKQN